MVGSKEKGEKRVKNYMCGRVFCSMILERRAFYKIVLVIQPAAQMDK
jgi:hypothetical protein